MNHLDDFVDRARAVSLADAAPNLGITLNPRLDDVGMPCPSCGGTDRFSINTRKNLWICRGSAGGGDAISLAAHLYNLDLSVRADFLEACSLVLSESIPDQNQQMSSADRAAREKARDQRQAEAAVKAAERQQAQQDYRANERKKAIGIYKAAGTFAESQAATYLQRRANLPSSLVQHINGPKFALEQTYWHGQDQLGRPLAHHTGPAMVAPFIDEHLNVIGCHITWIDLVRRGKLRPDLGRDEKGAPLPTKKMRGTKKGALIPIAGQPLTATRWVGGEGIENVAAYMTMRGFEQDCFYFAAGSIGNLCGPASQKGRFGHPTLKNKDKAGRQRAAMVSSPVPAEDRLNEAFWIAPQVRELVFVADGDSERVKTAADMVRGEARVRALRSDIQIFTIWPPEGQDFADMAGSEATR